MTRYFVAISQPEANSEFDVMSTDDPDAAAFMAYNIYETLHAGRFRGRIVLDTSDGDHLELDANADEWDGDAVDRIFPPT
jgi:hypothetical protein